MLPLMPFSFLYWFPLETDSSLIFLSYVLGFSAVVMREIAVLFNARNHPGNFVSAHLANSSHMQPTELAEYHRPSLR